MAAMDEAPPDAPAGGERGADPRLAAAHGFLAARAARDYDRAVGFFAPDAVWHSPVEDSRRGRAEIREALVAAERDTDDFESEVDRIALRGDRVVAEIGNRGWRHGRRIVSRQAHPFTVRGCRIRVGGVPVHRPP